MDKIIEKKKGLAAVFTKRALPYWMGAVVVFFVLWLVFRDNSSTLRVNGDTLSYGTVARGEFNDYIRVTGQVQPMTTIQISPLEGGVVQEIVTEEGSKVLHYGQSHWPTDLLLRHTLHAFPVPGAEQSHDITHRPVFADGCRHSGYYHPMAGTCKHA